MEWMWPAAWAWFGWNIVAPAIALLTVAILILLFNAPRMIRQARCSHEHVRENGSVEAVCMDCGRNLGFIGTWRELQKSKKG